MLFLVQKIVKPGAVVDIGPGGSSALEDPHFKRLDAFGPPLALKETQQGVLDESRQGLMGLGGPFLGLDQQLVLNVQSGSHA